MFGKIIGVINNNIRIVNLTKKAEVSLIGIHVIFQNNTLKYVGVIENIDENEVDIKLIGEIINNKFINGSFKKPTQGFTCRIISKEELETILGKQNYTNENLLIGNSSNYDGFKVTVDKNSFFSSHFAFLGNTGSGKSCGMTRLLQNLFTNDELNSPINAHFIIFDAYNDYGNAFSYLNNITNINFKNLNCDYTTALNGNDNIKIPPYFLDLDDLLLLLDVHTTDLIPAVENTLRIAYIFTSNDANVVEYQNSIIASSLLDILSSGKSSTQIRDQIIAVLTKFNTNDLNLDSKIVQPGYERTLRQCLLIDNQGKINAMDLVVDFLTTFIQKDMDNIEVLPGFVYTLDDLYNALEFSLINEGILSNNNSFDKLNSLKVRLRSIINSDLKKVFEVDKEITKLEFVESFFKVNNSENAQIVGVNFGNLDERTTKVLTKILSKIFFEYVSSLPNRGSFPIHLIIEEAHRYVQNDSDIDILGYNIFERITKEGRKYGILLGLITQRPTELSKTVLSQCGNFIVFKMYHPDDVDIVTSLSTYITDDLKEKIKTLHPGQAICFGNTFNTPLIVQFELPNPMPISSNIEVVKLWY